jgi:phosphoglycolate phosphatase-like HAD superfamily hydrolase
MRVQRSKRTSPIGRADSLVRLPESSRIVVVGDTPLDVAVAQAGGVRSVAVATGSYGPAALHTSGADVVLEDFSDLAATLAALEC